MELCPYFDILEVRASAKTIKKYSVCMGQKHMPEVGCVGNQNSELCSNPAQRAVDKSVDSEADQTLEMPARAKWAGKNIGGAWFYECSRCGEPKPPFGKNKYCNSCGALMED